jgi:hypothetical protein
MRNIKEKKSVKAFHVLHNFMIRKRPVYKKQTVKKSH